MYLIITGCNMLTVSSFLPLSKSALFPINMKGNFSGSVNPAWKYVCIYICIVGERATKITIYILEEL